MEKELFDWVDWDQQDTGAFSFYNVVLKKDIGSYKAGQKFESAYVDFQKGILEFNNYHDADDTGFREQIKMGAFKLSLNVV